MIQSNSSRSFRNSYKSESGNEVCSCGIEYSSRGIHLSVDIFDKEYFDTNPKEVSAMIDSFVAEANAILDAAGIPALREQTKK